MKRECSDCKQIYDDSTRVGEKWDKAIKLWKTQMNRCDECLRKWMEEK